VTGSHVPVPLCLVQFHRIPGRGFDLDHSGAQSVQPLGSSRSGEVDRKVEYAYSIE